MSFFDPDTLEPIAGDLIVALNPMRAWEEDRRKGHNGLHIQKGEQALVLATWTEGNQLRIRVVRDNRIILFSCPEHAVRKNWKVAVPAPRLPTSGCP